MRKRLKTAQLPAGGGRAQLEKRYDDFRKQTLAEAGLSSSDEEEEGQEDATERAHPALVMIDEHTGNKYMRVVDQKGVGESSEMKWLIRDLHEELKACGVSKLGARAKLATLIQPYGKALALKEQGNERYRASRFEDAADVYTKAIQLIPCPSTDLALNCYANRAACCAPRRRRL